MEINIIQIFKHNLTEAIFNDEFKKIIINLFNGHIEFTIDSQFDYNEAKTKLNHIVNGTT